MRAIATLFTFVLFAAGLAGCGTPGGCADNAGCPTLHVCVRTTANQPGVCAAVECVTNDDCDLGQYCDSESGDYVCTPGCTGDLDCRAGQTCNTATHACEAYGCRDTDLDCGYGEFCQDGQCVTASGHCDPGCSTDAECGVGGACLGWDPLGGSCIGLPGECGTGAECYCDDEACSTTQCYGNRCFAGCSTQDDCPRGYQCQNISGIGQICFADCTYIDQWTN